jgi:hypothetical protein
MLSNKARRNEGSNKYKQNVGWKAGRGRDVFVCVDGRVVLKLILPKYGIKVRICLQLIITLFCTSDKIQGSVKAWILHQELSTTQRIYCTMMFVCF